MCVSKNFIRDLNQYSILESQIWRGSIDILALVHTFESCGKLRKRNGFINPFTFF